MHFKSYKLIALVFFLLLSLTGFSQKDFVIVKKGNSGDINAYETALMAADLDRYRQKDQRTTLVFSSGMEVEVLSGKEVAALGQAVNWDRIEKVRSDVASNSRFELHASGIILERKDSPETLKK